MTTCHIDSTAQALTLHLTGALDSNGLDAIRSGIEGLAQCNDRDLVVNLSEVRFMDGAGIGALAFLAKRAVARGRRMFLEGASGQPLAILAELGLARVFGLDAPARRPVPRFGPAWGGAR